MNKEQRWAATKAILEGGRVPTPLDIFWLDNRHRYELDAEGRGFDLWDPVPDDLRQQYAAGNKQIKMLIERLGRAEQQRDLGMAATWDIVRKEVPMPRGRRGSSRRRAAGVIQ